MIPLALALFACIDGPGRGFAEVEAASLVPALLPREGVRVDVAALRLGHVRLEGATDLPAPDPGHGHRAGRTDHEEHEHGGHGEHPDDEQAALLLLHAEAPIDLLGGPAPLGPLPADLPAGVVERVVLEVEGVLLGGAVGEEDVSIDLRHPFTIEGPAALTVDRDLAWALGLTIELSVDAAALEATDEEALVEALRASAPRLRVEALE